MRSVLKVLAAAAVSVGLVFGQGLAEEPDKKDSKDAEFIFVVFDSRAETVDESYNRLALGARAVQAKSVKDLNVKLLKLDIATCNQGPGSRLLHLMEDKPKTSKRSALPGWVDAHRALLKAGATAVVYENTTADWWSPSEVLVLDPDDPTFAENQVCNLITHSRKVAKVAAALPPSTTPPTSVASAVTK